MKAHLPPINAHYGLFWHVDVWNNNNNKNEGKLRGQIKEVGWNCQMGQNFYVIEIYSKEKFVGQSKLWVKSEPLKITRLENQIAGRVHIIPTIID